MNELYNVVGISKQAVSQYSKRQHGFNSQCQKLIVRAEELRQKHPGCGVEKMYYTLKPENLGRDRFIELMMSQGFRLKTHRNYRRTTYAGSLFYPNLIKGLRVNKPSMIWQSDLTYIEVDGKFYYAVFIIDVYTKKIVGYHLSDNMRAESNVKALSLALRNHKPPDVHHSDRGSQYTSIAYTNLLKSYGCKVSMGLKPQDNAYAERINGTIKGEYLHRWKPKTYVQLKRYTEVAVNHYNNKRPHDHLNKMTPADFEDKWLKNQLSNNPVITIFDDRVLV